MVLKTSEALQANKDFLSFPSALDWQIKSELFDSVQFSDFFSRLPLLSQLRYLHLWVKLISGYKRYIFACVHTPLQRCMLLIYRIYNVCLYVISRIKMLMKTVKEEENKNIMLQ